MTDVILSASNLSVGFHGRKRRALLQGLTLALSPERLSCLIGRNGVGKSTLIRTLAGLQEPIAGTVSAAGEDLYRIPPEKRARLVSSVLSGGVHVGNLKAAQVVELGRLPYTDWLGRLTDADREIVYSVLEKIGALPLADRRYLHLSDGEKQKILIARALAQQTPILFLDEPTAFLDWPNRVETLLLLKEIAVSEKKAVLFSSHDLELVMRFADVIWVLDDDRAFFSETREEILKSGALKNAFGGKYLEFLTKKSVGESTVPKKTERI